MESIRDIAFKAAPQKTFIIDAHTHIFPLQCGGWIQRDGSPEAFIAMMDRLGIDCAVTSSALISMGSTMAEINQTIASLIDAYPGRIYGQIVILPGEGIEAAKREIEIYMRHPGFVGFKFLTGGYHGSLRQPAYLYALEAAAEAACPVTIHKWQDTPTLSDIRTVVEKLPKLKLISAHLGGGHNPATKEFLSFMKEYPNVYMDTCGSVYTSYTIADLVEEIGSDRLIFASDSTCIDPRFELGKITLSPVSDEIKEKILAGNFLRILKDSQLGKIEVI